MAYTPTFGLPVIGTAPDQYATDTGLNAQVNAQLQALYDATMHFIGPADAADLNDLIDPGVVTQFYAESATPARHYPVQRGGVLIISRNAGTDQVYQAYITPEGSFGRFRGSTGVWDAWSGIDINPGIYQIDAVIDIAPGPDTHTSPGTYRIPAGVAGMVAYGWPVEGIGAGGTLTVTGVTGGVQYQTYHCTQGMFARYLSGGVWYPWRGIRLGASGQIFDPESLNRDLGTLDLDDDAAWAPGIYYQPNSARATPERHYPQQRGGTLIVAGAAGNTIIQTYITADGIATRYGSVGVWLGAWSITPAEAQIEDLVSRRTGARILSLGSSTLDYMGAPLADFATRAGLQLVDGSYAGDTIQGSAWVLGINVPTVTFPAGQIVDGANAVNVTWPWAEVTSPHIGQDCILSNGVLGRLTKLTDLTGTFTCELAAPVSVGATALRCEVVRGRGERDSILLFGGGKNNLTGSDSAEWVFDRTVDCTDAMAAGARVIVLGHFANTDAGTVQRGKVTAINTLLAAKYGASYLSLLDLMAAPATWTRLGLTRTAADNAALAEGRLPPSLSLDPWHLSAAMGPVVVDAIEQRARDLGYLGHLATGARVDAGLADLAAEVRDGRVWAPLGSRLTPAGLTPPSGSDMAVCRTTDSNILSFWRLELDPLKWPATASDREVQDAQGGWWLQIWSSVTVNAAQAAIAALQNGRAWAPEGSRLTPEGLAPPPGTTLIVCRTTTTVRLSFWRRESVETGVSATLVQDSAGGWWKLVWASDDATFAGFDVTPALTRVLDRNGATAAALDLGGGLRLSGLGGRSVQDHIRGLGERIARVARSTANTITSYIAAPALLRLSDATGAAWGVFDQVGGLHLPGLGGQSVQDHIRRANAVTRATATSLRHATHINAVTDLGVDRRGRADCSVLINRAIDKISRNRQAYGGRAVIYYPDGDYRLNGPIVPQTGISHIGAGPRTRFLPYSYWPVFMRADDEYNPNRDYIEDCVFANFQMQCENQTRRAPTWIWVGTKGMYIQGFRRCTFTDIQCHNSGATGLGIDFPDMSVLQRVLVTNGGRQPKEDGWTSAPGSSGIGIGTGWQQEEPLVIAECQAYECANYGVFVERQRPGAGAEYAARGYILSGNICRGNQFGIGEAGCDGTIIAGNQISENDRHGIALHGGTLSGGPHPGYSTIISGNQICRNGAHGVHWDSSVMHSPRGYSASANRIEGNGGAGHHWMGNTGATTDDLVIRGDEVVGNGAEGIWLEQGRLTNCDLIGPRLLGNVGAAIRLDAAITGGRVAAATLRDLTATPSQTASITGVGDLTDFDISEVVAHGASAQPINLTGTLTRVTYGRNTGV